MDNSFRQVNYGDSHAGYQSIMFKKTPLDLALEVVEDKYGSIDKAPQSAVKSVRRAASGMGLYIKPEKRNRNTVQYKPIHINNHHKAKRIPSSFRLWKNKDGLYCTNYLPLVESIKYTRKGYSPKDSCSLGGISYRRFKRLHLRRKGYVWHYKNISQRVSSIQALIHYCRSLHWSFGPLTYGQWTFHNYKGVIKPYNYFINVHYRKDK